jgi:hypothetical protein
MMPETSCRTIIAGGQSKALEAPTLQFSKQQQRSTTESNAWSLRNSGVFLTGGTGGHCKDAHIAPGETIQLV